MPAEIIVYSKKTCPHCTRAKRLLASRGLTFTEVMLDGADTELRQRFFADTNNARTVPQIMVGGRCIGGADDLKAKIDTPEFQQMIGGS